MSLYDLPPMRRREVKRTLAQMIPQRVVAPPVITDTPRPKTVTLVERCWPTLEAALLGRHRVCRWMTWAVGLLCAAVVVSQLARM